ncbi:F-box domain-containing protein [Fusarium falciforme]|uniref:F-box domain-containing protein n=1 Tax=Fusarium falciforme TaxID=195108 RepID=UPI00230025BA|nr:F-box domain-containing protein [Fusarium falciforme]WAO86393.1 F-box domain-containing protein [Fusarium falciforme]
MGFSFVYCVVCGCPFDIPPRDEVFDEEHNWASEDSLEDETKQWLCRFRLLGATSSLEKFTTPPFRMPRNESTTPGLFVSDFADWAFTEGLYFRLGGSSYRVLSSAKDTNDVLFPLHDACLTIVQHVLTWCARFSPEGGSPPSLSDVYKALCAQFAFNVQEKKIIAKERGFYGSTDYMEYGLEFGHGYYGAREFWASEGWEPTKANEWYCDDPINVENLSEFVSTLLAEEPFEARHKENARPGTNFEVSNLKVSLQPSLEYLPREILDLIASFLPAASAQRLRRCSKTLLSRVVLDQQFWRRQLLDGCVAPYNWELGDVHRYSKTPVIPADKTLGHHNWEGLARKLVCNNQIMRGDESMPSPPWGLRNRCRIWSLASHLITSSEG